MASCLPLLFLVSLAASAQGQRLLNVVPLGDDPTSGGWSVDVDHDLVRSAPQRLEFEVPDGRVLTPEMSVFEDRGDGNAMWMGGYPELGYDSVVLTLQDGQLLGRLGLPEGGTYWLRPGSAGTGLLTEGRETSAPACGGGVVPELDPVPPAVAASRAEPPRRVVGASNHDRLDILMLYTAGAATRLGQAGWGEPGAAMQAAIDYLNLVFRNSQVGLTAHMVHHGEAPAALGQIAQPLDALTRSQEVLDLRSEHGADLVHLFFDQYTEYCGLAWLMLRRHAPRSFWPRGYAITTVGGPCLDLASQVRDGEYASQFETFAHEIGHNLGANHDPDNTNLDPGDAVEPYAFGHHNFEPQPNVKSVMSYNEGRQEPLFSTTRVRPRGYVMGVANERENERAVQRTIHLVAELSAHLPDPGEPPPPPQPPPGDRPLAPTDVSVMATGSTSVKVTWTDRSNNEDGFQVHARLQGSGWATVASVAANTESADIDGLRAGGRYDFRVRAFNRSGGRNSRMTKIVLPQVEYTECEPEASQITFEHGFSVSMCVEYRHPDTGETVTEDAQNYRLESSQSGILYFFDRDNAEVLVKVLDTCGISPFYWVYVAPVTDLAFNLHVDNLNVEESVPGRRWTHRNPKGGTTATTRSDNRAFPCETSASTVAGALGPAGAPGLELVDSGFPVARAAIAPPALSARAPVGVAQAIAPNEATDCEPEPVATLADGYTVNMCVEYLDPATGEPTVTEAQDYGLDSEQSGLLYFFKPDNAEVLVKVLKTCGISPYYWVYVAPVTDLAFNLTVVSPNPDDEVWTHSNRLGQTAAARSDNKAFPCSD